VSAQYQQLSANDTSQPVEERNAEIGGAVECVTKKKLVAVTLSFEVRFCRCYWGAQELYITLIFMRTNSPCFIHVVISVSVTTAICRAIAHILRLCDD
jgi:hypothetical protein